MGVECAVDLRGLELETWAGGDEEVFESDVHAEEDGKEKLAELADGEDVAVCVSGVCVRTGGGRGGGGRRSGCWGADWGR